MKRIFTISILFLLMLSMFIPGGIDLVGDTQAAASVSITLTSNPKFWVDANKCGPEGPRGAWMSFIIKNTGDVDLDYVAITFNGFDNPVFVDPVDKIRLHHEIPVGGEVPAFFYVDYAGICLGTLVGNLSNYSLTVYSPTLPAPVHYNDQVETDTLLTAMAAGVLQSTQLGPGIWAGQILEQRVVFDYGNNKGLYFQPAGQAIFNEVSYRLVQSYVESTTNITGITGLEYNRLFYPDVSVQPSGQLTVVFYWEVLKISNTEYINPWAAAQSGQKFKYTGFGATQVLPPPVIPLTISKSVTPTYFATPSSPGYGGEPGLVLYTVNIYNDALVPVALYEIRDVLPDYVDTPDCVRIVNPFFSPDSIIQENSSYEYPGMVPGVGETGEIVWIGKIPANPTTKTYMVPATEVDQITQEVITQGTLTLQYTADISACAEDHTYTNSVTAYYGVRIIDIETGETDAIELGPVTASFIIGYDPTAITLPSDPEASVEQDIHITWETANEVDLVGFKLYRESLGMPMQLVYQVEAALAGQMMGATYEFIDKSAQPGVVYEYWLEVAYRDGTSVILTEFLKPVSIQSPFKTYLPLLVR